MPVSIPGIGITIVDIQSGGIVPAGTPTQLQYNLDGTHFGAIPIDAGTDGSGNPVLTSTTGQFTFAGGGYNLQMIFRSGDTELIPSEGTLFVNGIMEANTFAANDFQANSFSGPVDNDIYLNYDNSGDIQLGDYQFAYNATGITINNSNSPLGVLIGNLSFNTSPVYTYQGFAITNTLDTGGGQMMVGGSSPQYALDIYDIQGTSIDVGNSTTGLWNIGSNGVGYFGGGIEVGSFPYILMNGTGDMQVQGNFTASGSNFSVNTSTIGFFSGTPVGQQTANAVTAGYTANSSANIVYSGSTFTGNVGSTAYTLSDIVALLKAYNLATH